MLRRWFGVVMSGLIVLSANAQEQELDRMRLTLSAEKPQKSVFSNKKAAFWYGEVQQQNVNSFQGYTILEQRYAEDYSIVLNGEWVDRSTAANISLFPDRIVREYAHFSETFYFVDSLNLLLLEIDSGQRSDIGIYFHFVEPVMQANWRPDRENNSIETAFYEFGFEKPVFISCKLLGDGQKIKPDIVSSGGRFGKYDHGIGLRMELKGKATLAVLFSFTRPEQQRTAEKLADIGNITEIRKSRVRRLIGQNEITTNDPELNNAYRWALSSMDDLVTNQRGKGIWAGLPWFNNYWGRDSFISFTGALLCSGQFREALAVLRSFSGFQNRDKSSDFYGRIPNRVMINEIIYNTVDGTPWFIKACENYVRYSGDTGFIEEIFPVVRRATGGAILKHVDGNGFLTHADAETWMDAVGSEGPWSPRGNRAVEVQALWIEQLRISAEWARLLGFGDLAVEWEQVLEKARRNFRIKFWNGSENMLFDHLNSDDSPDLQVRPNQIFAVTVPRNSLLDESQQNSVIKTVVNRLTYPWGVGSLWQKDPNFHPWHHYAPYYVPDAAYHNGIVWTWVTGPVLSALFEKDADLAYRLLKDEAKQVLEKDAVGAQSELLEAWPRPGTNYPLISGTVSQAWNMAEFIRNIQQDLLGIRPNLPAGELTLHPNLPSQKSEADFNFRIEDSQIKGRYEKQGGEFFIRLETSDRELPARKLNLVIEIPLSPEKEIRFRTYWQLATPLEMKIDSNGQVTVNRSPVKDVEVLKKQPIEGLAFCQPDMNQNLPVLRGPAFNLISPEDAIQKPGRLTKIVLQADDPEGDDHGPKGKYVYPEHPAFEKGIFDGESVKIRRDDAFYYFELEYANLVNPGWRPEPGYQLTYTAIALNFGKTAGIQRTRAGMNANFSIPFEFAYNYIVYVGNGFRVVDAKGEIAAEYRPQDTLHPIGFPAEKIVRFSVPISYFPGQPLRSAFVMIGGQDDHGAGGVGEFRKVGKSASEWQGGGGEREDGNSNVYDTIEVR